MHEAWLSSKSTEIGLFEGDFMGVSIEREQLFSSLEHKTRS